MGDDPATSVVDRVAALPRRREHGLHRLVGVPHLDRLRPDADDRRARDPRVPRARGPAPTHQRAPGRGRIGSIRGSRRALRDVARRPERCAAPARRPLGDQPVVLVFLRHFGCLHCREHAAQLRERYDEITDAGGDIVAVGTGDQRYAEAFVADERIPFLVLVDDDAQRRARGVDDRRSTGSSSCTRARGRRPGRRRSAATTSTRPACA